MYHYVNIAMQHIDQHHHNHHYNKILLSSKRPDQNPVIQRQITTANHQHGQMTSLSAGKCTTSPRREYLTEQCILRPRCLRWQHIWALFPRSSLVQYGWMLCYLNCVHRVNLLLYRIVHHDNNQTSLNIHAMGPFQLFPPSSPDIETKALKIPIRKGRKPAPAPGVSSSSIPLQEINEMDARRAREDDVKIQPPRKVHVKSHSESGLGSQPKSGWTLRSVNQDDRASSSSSSLANNSSTQIPPAPALSSPDTLSQQPYYQQPSTSRLPPFRHKPLPPRPLPRPRPPGLTLSPEPEIDRDLGPKTVPASVMNFPAGIRESVEMGDSSTAELRKLWDVANGQRMEGGLGRFCLRLTRYACLFLA